MPALLFNPNTFFRILQFFFFWFLSWLSGKKNNPLLTMTVILGIVVFNLLVPYGRVLFSAGAFKITEGALMAGIHRAVTLEGLIMLSRVSIRQDLRLPGGFGELIGESFRLFAVIMDSRQRITRKNLMGDIDALMIELSEDASAALPQRPQKKTAAAGYIILAAAVILSWLPLLY
jgi:heptaprenyl diphosphate synthase